MSKHQTADRLRLLCERYKIPHGGLTRREMRVLVDKAMNALRDLYAAAPFGGYSCGLDRPGDRSFRHKGLTYRAVYYHNGGVAAIVEATGD